MKNTIKIILNLVVTCILTVAAVSCTQFPTHLGYVESDLQPVAFVFSPGAEGAPGDTLGVAAIFEGQRPETFTCSLSTKYQMNQYGSDTAFDFMPVDTKSKISNDSIIFSLVIPSDFFTGNIAFRPILTAIAQQVNIPVSAITPELLNSFLSQDFSKVDSTTQKLFADAAKGLSGKAVIHMHVNGGYLITRDIIIRYNSKIKNNPYIYANNNPDPFWIGIYKVKTDPKRLFFSPALQKETDTLLCLYLKPGTDSAAIAGPMRYTDTILIDTGYTYYAAADSGMIEYKDKNGTIHRDTSLDKSVSFKGRVDYEYFTYRWFYHVDSTSGIKPVNSLIISYTGSYFSDFSPPLDVNAVKISMWLNISDYFTGELNRPVATSLNKVNCVLKYSESYSKSVKKK